MTDSTLAFRSRLRAAALVLALALTALGAPAQTSNGARARAGDYIIAYRLGAASTSSPRTSCTRRTAAWSP